MSVDINKEKARKVAGLKSYSNLIKGMAEDTWNIDVCRFLSFYTKTIFIYRKKEICESDPRPDKTVQV